MSNPRRKASVTTRRLIVEALRSPGRRFLDPKSSSRNHLDYWDLKATGFYTDLADGLEASDNLYLKPKNHQHDPQRYQCVLAYPESDPYPALDIHVTQRAATKGDDRHPRKRHRTDAATNPRKSLKP